ncbi:UDP-N-acetylmuramoyl-tripeptide--D-alanyl-D-alanine ligase [Cellvibrio sp. OA-2007]|uniref:UDP-N-acetylmuramoyl-tripeptide--D-alanyl-D- alanine ligase n=1 Tax=Cellvibrio sp. OA-2007 TaxID=529823 RepID=UPI00078560D0|nr:UDP-N-acetylmuramoyl-tripeptide--D-alanyl-D-alanine ligase [Cellvibrio sp. OA-2007]
MIKPLTLKWVEEFIATHKPLRAVTAQLKQGDVEFTRVNTDSRTLAAGELFVALRGERFDAHDFIQDAVAKKPCALVVERFFPEIKLPQLVVSDSLLALGQIAALNRSLFLRPIIAITGSSGKTTVKTLLAGILAECGSTHATKGNFNNHIGVPLTLLQLEAHHEFAVIEMGASGPAEIEYLCSLAKPQITMINNVMAAHIQGFGSLQGVARAKGEIYAALPTTGTAVVNIDDRFAPDWLAALTNRKVIRVAYQNRDADCFAQDIEPSANSIEFAINLQGASTQVSVNAQGEHNVRNALMAAACASAVGATLQQIKQGLANFAPVAGRMSRHVGINNAQIIDDSYNANPGSVRAAIDVLAQKSQGILVLGDLGELGTEAPQLHTELGEYARAKKIAHLFTVGKLSENASRGFGEGAQHFVDQASLVEHLKKIANKDTTLLIKGSRSAAMDLVVRQLCDSVEGAH